MTAPPPPASAAWREGDHPGLRRWVDLPQPLQLEGGGMLPGVRIAYQTWGRLNGARSNAVLIEHALTGHSHATGAIRPGHPTPGWWDGMVGPGSAVDTDRFFVVCPNVLGGCQGSTGPSSPAPDGRQWGSRWPLTTVADQVAAEAVLADSLGISRWAGIVGGSMGGFRALEWAVAFPERVAAVVAVACSAAATGEQIALGAAQMLAIRADPQFAGGDYYDAPPGGGPHVGMGIARRLAHLSYRSEGELQQRFGRSPQPGERPLTGGRYAVESYLDHHAEKLARRFDANTYLTLTAAMNHFDIGRRRGGVASALSRVSAAATVIGIDSDRLYRPWQQEELVRLLPTADRVRVVLSPYGHDGFLIERDQVGALVRAGLTTSGQDRVSRRVEHCRAR